MEMEMEKRKEGGGGMVRKMGREKCWGCSRPSSVCLCAHLPSPPMSTLLTSVFILQHPNESRHKLCTVPFLSLSLSRCFVLPARSLRPASSPLLDFLHSHSSSSIALLLFPSPSALPINLWFASHLSSPCSTCLSPPPTVPPSPLASPSHPPHSAALSTLFPPYTDPSAENVPTSRGIFVASNASPHLDGLIPAPLAGGPCPPSPSHTDDARHPPHIVLIAMDGTWQHAQEMMKASAPFLSSFAIPVCLPYDAGQVGSSIYDSDVILRKEPFKGCMTTLEAVATCLRILEPDGEVIYRKLMGVLREMVKFQASNINVAAARGKKEDPDGNGCRES